MNPRGPGRTWGRALRLMPVLVALLLASTALAQQIGIPRIEAMPNKPSPYLMRNWRQAALGYDSLVTNLSASGRYLPLVWLSSATIYYPPPTFVMPSYVGAPSPSTGEAINCLPAVLSGSLVGIDKTNQNGLNWVLMCREWFNTSPAENVYLNNPGASSGSDWWYDLMPNVFFYQLYSLYPATSSFALQFTSIAERWLAALRAMGGSTTPWTLANVNHTAWNLSTMTPTDLSWREPESAGSIAWLLYNAYTVTGNQQYRIGAEIAMESLLAYSTNPSYELQLPYATYLAARMNAELGTTYDVAKLMNWCFSDGAGTIRTWGVTVGNWGGDDCSGLIGELNANNYPFYMNSVEQVGALVPMVRYDPRFARAIGKWVLNAANAARLFYTNYLPDDHQDSSAWAHEFDPTSTIAHEAMRQTDPANPGISPFATGDAAASHWAATNYGLYGSSHVGILGAIIDTTNMPMILRLNVLKTDYFHGKAFPTYLYFNPDSVQHGVQVDLGAGQHDLYDAVSKTFLLSGQSGVQLISIPGNSAVLAVLTPSGGTPAHVLDQFLINDTVVDFHSGQTISNYPPRIKSLSVPSATIIKGMSTGAYCTAADQDGDSLFYTWSTSGGAISGSGSSILWTAPDSAGTFLLICRVNDTHGAQVSDTLALQVVLSINHPPVIGGMTARPRKINLGSGSTITCAASDADSNALTYSWSSGSGVLSGAGPTVTWTAPGSAGNYYVTCLVDDGHGGQARDSIGLEVRDFSIMQTGSLVAYYPFNGNANDASGFNNNGTVFGATLTSDRFGHPASAYIFNGLTNYILVPNDTSLNFQNAITMNFWMKVGLFFTEREQYLISHGNWQNRWKVSLTPVTNTLRWTVKTGSGTKNLDSETHLLADSLYNVTVLYSGSDYEIYLNGQLDAFTSWSGLIAKTIIDLTIAQDLPTEQLYNFYGVLDDIRIYNYALSVPAIEALYDINASVGAAGNPSLPTDYVLEQNYPNPFNPSTTIKFGVPLPGSRNVSLRVYDVLGREVATLLDAALKPGFYSVTWDARERASGVYFARLVSERGIRTEKMLLLK